MICSIRSTANIDLQAALAAIVLKIAATVWFIPSIVPDSNKIKGVKPMNIFKRIFAIAITVSLFSISFSAQTLPAGKWLLISYQFADKQAKPLEGLKITLNVRNNGHLGGSSGCNSYGGSYAVEDGKLKVADIISTMMACEEPSPQFERNFFATLSSGTVSKIENSELTITDPNSRNFLRFVEVKPDPK